VAVYRHTPFGNITFSLYERKLSVDKNKKKYKFEKKKLRPYCVQPLAQQFISIG